MKTVFIRKYRENIQMLQRTYGILGNMPSYLQKWTANLDKSNDPIVTVGTKSNDKTKPTE